MIRPKSNQVILEPIPDSDYFNPTSQLIKIPDVAKERWDQGIIKYLGRDVDPELEIGQHVIFSGYSGTTVRVDNEILIVMLSKDIKAIIKEENNVVPGLYFKQKISSEIVEEKIRNIVGFHLLDSTCDDLLRMVSSVINEVMIPAQYEDSIKLIAESRIGIIDVKKEEHSTQRDRFE